MSSPTRAERRIRVGRRSRRGDAGMTLVEMVLGITITGIVMASIGMSLLVVMRTDKPTTARLTEARDVAFLQTYLPVDYSSAISRDTTPGLQPVAGQTMPGTNVLTLFREEKNGTTVITTTVSYRYVQQGDAWQLVRYEWGDPQHVGQLYRTVVAHDLAAPPAGWTSAAAPTHAVSVSARNESTYRPIGDDLTITFTSGNSFATGGAALSADTELPSDYSGGTSDPATVKSRCGGRVTLVLDVSGSIGSVNNGPENVKTAANGFIDAFTGTPSDMSIEKFSTWASPVYPDPLGTYFSVLDPSSTAIDDAKTAVNGLPIGGGTGWEDALYRTTRESSGTNYALLPELVVFVTDGDPTQLRSYPWNWNWLSGSQQQALLVDAAVTAANYARERDARVIGILIGNAAQKPASVARLKQVVGSVEWTGTSATDIGNAAVADFFLPPNGDFSKLGGVLKAVAAGECGGTVTVQKKIDMGGGNLVDPTGEWSYTSDVGVKELLPSDIAVTFDYTFDTGKNSKTVQIIEQPNAGFVLDRVDCTSGGQVLNNGSKKMLGNGVTGVELKINANEAVSCTFISVPA